MPNLSYNVKEQGHWKKQQQPNTYIYEVLVVVLI